MREGGKEGGEWRGGKEERGKKKKKKRKKRREGSFGEERERESR